MLAIAVLMALFAPYLPLRDPLAQDLSAVLRPPGSTTDAGVYVLGTDSLGRDVLSRLVYGARPLLTIVALAVSSAGIFGFAWGLLAGSSRGLWGTTGMRIADIQLSIPPVVLAIVLAVALQPSVTSVVIAIALVTWPQYARVIRSEVLRVRTSSYVQLARTAGLGRGKILWHHVIPNVLNSFVVMLTLQASTAIIYASALSFLGVGVQQPTPDWGNMLAAGTGYMEIAWWMVVVPGLAITGLVLSINGLGESLRDRLDPTSMGGGV